MRNGRGDVSGKGPPLFSLLTAAAGEELRSTAISYHTGSGSGIRKIVVSRARGSKFSGTVDTRRLEVVVVFQWAGMVYITLSPERVIDHPVLSQHADFIAPVQSRRFPVRLRGSGPICRLAEIAVLPQRD
jgi:hypothetical protein